MVSKTRRTKNIRANKKSTAGRKRKSAQENHGTTASAEELFKVQD